jgi:DNA-binding transcriptional regulator YhcF (GntR family)
MTARRPVIAVDVDSPTPPSMQIFEQIRAAIERGELQADATLPTVRQLAGDLGVAPNTVSRAYADLKTEGWVIGEERRLTRVAPALPNAGKDVRRKLLAEAIDAFCSALKSRGYAPDEIAREMGRRLGPLEA